MTTQPLVSDYLADLRSTATDRLGPVRAAELVADIGEHIDAAVASGQSPQSVIERLGSPVEIVGAEAPPGPVVPAPSRLRAQEVLAIILVLVGFALFAIGWIVGVVLLWVSDRWSVRDKLIGTLLWPGGLGAVLVVGMVSGPTTSTIQECDSSGACTTIGDTSSGTPTWVVITIFAVLLVVPVLTSVHLARSARTPTDG